MTSSLDVGMSLFATADLVLRHGSKLVEICQAVKNAEIEIKQRILCIENHWKRTSLQLQFLQRIWTSLDVEHQSIQEQILQVLINKLTIAISKIDKLVSKSRTSSRVADGPQLGFSLRRWRYAIRKDDLDKIIKDLEDWQRMFDPSWFTTMLIRDSQIDAELDAYNNTQSIQVLKSAHSLRTALRDTEDDPKEIFLNPNEMKTARISEIAMSSCRAAQRPGSTKTYILNRISVFAQGSHQQLTKDIRKLSARLSHADPIDFGLLQCKGVIKQATTMEKSQNMQAKEFVFVFRMVQGYEALHSLRSWLHTGSASHSLSIRLDMAKQMARSVSSVHTFGFVHKNIRPENILICTSSSSSLAHTFLVGFEEFRSADGTSLRRNDSAWEKDLYHHPSRQGPIPDEYFVMQHDIYSLGVCLLELGLWETFAIYDGQHCTLSPTLVGCSNELLFTWQPDLVKEVLLRLTRNVLPTRMGTKYAEVVETCLTCLDEDNIGFGYHSELQHPDGVLVGVRYIEKVLLQLDSISM